MSSACPVSGSVRSKRRRSRSFGSRGGCASSRGIGGRARPQARTAATERRLPVHFLFTVVVVSVANLGGRDAPRIGTSEDHRDVRHSTVLQVRAGAPVEGHGAVEIFMRPTVRWVLRNLLTIDSSGTSAATQWSTSTQFGTDLFILRASQGSACPWASPAPTLTTAAALGAKQRLPLGSSKMHDVG